MKPKLIILSIMMLFILGDLFAQDNSITFDYIWENYQTTPEQVGRLDLEYYDFGETRNIWARSLLVRALLIQDKVGPARVKYR